MNQQYPPVIKQKEFWGVVQMEGFYRKKGKARRHQQSIFGADTFFYEEGLQGFYHADKSFAGPGAGMEKG